ncbi:Transcriptional regulatory protein OmpR [compost metagenome]
MLTARDDSHDQVLGLEMGADDYVTKPCEPRVLLARVRTLLRRSSLSEPLAVNDRILMGNLCIDLSERTVTWRAQPVELSSGEYNLLVVLARHAGEVLSRDQILQRLRGIEFNGTDRSVDVAISKLRRKFDDNAGEARKIKTVWGKGYLFSRSEWEC